MRPALEVAGVFRRHGEAFRRGRGFHLGRVERRIMSAIELRRTPALGGHLEQCGDCGLVRHAYNSCRNRHCPKCQGLARAEWLEARQAELLPVPACCTPGARHCSIIRTCTASPRRRIIAGPDTMDRLPARVLATRAGALAAVQDVISRSIAGGFHRR